MSTNLTDTFTFHFFPLLFSPIPFRILLPQWLYLKNVNSLRNSSNLALTRLDQNGFHPSPSESVWIYLNLSESNLNLYGSMCITPRTVCISLCESTVTVSLLNSSDFHLSLQYLRLSESPGDLTWAGLNLSVWVSSLLGSPPVLCWAQPGDRSAGPSPLLTWEQMAIIS